jgi:outer membrane autotransporter protein
VSTRLRDRFLGRARPVEDTHAIAASSGAPALVGEGPQGWIDWVGIYGDQDARRDVIGYALDQEGLMLGFDTTVGTRTVLGADAVYLDRNVGFDRSGSRSDGRTLAVGVYGSRALREWSWLEVGIAHAWHHDDVDRALSFADVRRVAHSDRSARQWSVRGGVAGVAALGPLQVVPGVHLLYSQLGEDGFEERDAGALGLDVSSRSTHSLRTLIGFDAESDPLRLGSEGWSLRPDAGVFWVHELLDDERGIRASFVGAPGSFRTLTSQSFDDGLLARAGLSLSWLDRTTFRVGYQLDTDRGGYTQHAVDAGFEVRF